MCVPAPPSPPLPPGKAKTRWVQRIQGDNAKMEAWQKETESLLKAADEPFFNIGPDNKNTMRESACESRPPFNVPPTCNTDQRSFKAYLSRFMALTYQLCPFTRDFIMERLRASAIAAVGSCTGGDDGQTCGLSWLRGGYDGSPYGIAKGGVGEHMAVMEVVQSLLVGDTRTPRTQATGGTSKGDAAAGSSGGLSDEDLRQTEPTTAGDRAGAGILTTICLGSLVGLTYWLIRE